MLLARRNNQSQPRDLAADCGVGLLFRKPSPTAPMNRQGYLYAVRNRRRAAWIPSQGSGAGFEKSPNGQALTASDDSELRLDAIPLLRHGDNPLPVDAVRRIRAALGLGHEVTYRDSSPPMDVLTLRLFDAMDGSQHPWLIAAGERAA